jgi:hypothetical protein
MQAPTSTELIRFVHTIARRVSRLLVQLGWLRQHAEDCYRVGTGLEVGPMEQLPGSSITYRIAVSPQRGRTVFTCGSCRCVMSRSTTR